MQTGSARKYHRGASRINRGEYEAPRTEKEKRLKHGKSPLDAREEQVQPILKEAADACKRLGGLAEIDARYVIVDRKRYNVAEK